MDKHAAVYIFIGSWLTASLYVSVQITLPLSSTLQASLSYLNGLGQCFATPKATYLIFVCRSYFFVSGMLPLCLALE
jgi:hypothetical protein